MRYTGAMRTVVVCIALGLSACGGDDSSGAGTGGTAGTGGASSDGGIDADNDASVGSCPASGVSKGPWALRVDGTSAVVRWEACREGVSPELTASEGQGGAPLVFQSAVAPFVVDNTYKAAFLPDLPADEAGTYYMHEVTLSGLTPATCYQYSLGADASLGGRLCTARQSGDAFQFLGMADTNPGLGTSTRDMLALVESEPYDFTVHGGDVQYYASGFETWASWFPSMAPMLGHGAFLPALGNHESEKEDEYEQYYARFFGGAGFDGTDAYYRFQSGGVWFFALDTEGELGAGSAQLAWLDTQLADASAQPGYRFSVLFLHRPLLTCGDKSQSDSDRALLQPLMEQYGVELVLQGHMHGYERFEVPKASNPSQTITYMTIGGGGGALGDVDENIDRPTCSMRVASGKFYHLALFDVGATSLSVKVIDPTNAVKDSFDKPLP